MNYKKHNKKKPPVKRLFFTDGQIFKFLNYFIFLSIKLIKTTKTNICHKQAKKIKKPLSNIYYFLKTYNFFLK